MPARIALHDGSALIAQSRAGIVATVIQSTQASRPIRAANNWLTMVENVLLIRPSSAAARQRDFVSRAVRALALPQAATLILTTRPRQPSCSAASSRSFARLLTPLGNRSGRSRAAVVCHERGNAARWPGQ